MGAKVVHFEVMTTGDAAELGKFYSEIFDWNVDANNEFKYGLVPPEDAGIGGGIGGVPDPNMPGHVTFYVQVPDPEATLQDIESRGGQRIMGPETITEGTTIALFRDPQGNVIGLTKGE
ncbi:MAG: VOC family protein [Actinomycetota bacterium]|nr:VOC family protein [Actinomycetota bacterium]